jgi:hypothetical protein
MAAGMLGRCFVREGEFIRLGDGTRSSTELSAQDRYALGLYEFPREQEPLKLNRAARRKAQRVHEYK